MNRLFGTVGVDEIDQPWCRAAHSTISRAEILIQPRRFEVPVDHENLLAESRQQHGDIGERHRTSDPTLVRVERTNETGFALRGHLKPRQWNGRRRRWRIDSFSNRPGREGGRVLDRKRDLSRQKLYCRLKILVFSAVAQSRPEQRVRTEVDRLPRRSLRRK